MSIWDGKVFNPNWASPMLNPNSIAGQYAGTLNPMGQQYAGMVGGLGFSSNNTPMQLQAPQPVSFFAPAAPAPAAAGGLFPQGQSPAQMLNYTPTTPAAVAAPAQPPYSWGAENGNMPVPISGKSPMELRAKLGDYTGLRPDQMNAEQLANFYKDNQPSQALGWANAGINLAGAGLNGYLGWKALDLADKQFALQSKIGEKNLAAQLSSYNTAQEDRLRGRHSAEYNASAEGKAEFEREMAKRRVT